MRFTGHVIANAIKWNEQLMKIECDIFDTLLNRYNVLGLPVPDEEICVRYQMAEALKLDYTSFMEKVRKLEGFKWLAEDSVENCPESKEDAASSSQAELKHVKNWTVDIIKEHESLKERLAFIVECFVV